MPEHIFLQERRIEPADINEVLDLTATGELEWGQVPRTYAYGSNVGYSMGEETADTMNLHDVVVGFTPAQDFQCLRMIDAEGSRFYVKDGSEAELLTLARRVLTVAQVAMTVPGGRLSGTVEDCRTCERRTGHLALYNAAHGIAGAVMSGSERLECVSCGETSPLPQAV